jgi:transcriptional regulator with XRE-family HTH domain
MDEQKQRLSRLLHQMQGELSQRAFARKIQINSGSLQQYMIGDAFPEKENREKIAAARGWTYEELMAYLSDRPVEPTQSIDELLQNVRTLSPQDALKVLRVALDVVESAL